MTEILLFNGREALLLRLRVPVSMAGRPYFFSPILPLSLREVTATFPY